MKRSSAARVCGVSGPANVETRPSVRSSRNEIAFKIFLGRIRMERNSVLQVCHKITYFLIKRYRRAGVDQY